MLRKKSPALNSTLLHIGTIYYSGLYVRVKNYLGWIKKHAASGACGKTRKKKKKKYRKKRRRRRKKKKRRKKKRKKRMRKSGKKKG